MEIIGPVCLLAILLASLYSLRDVRRLWLNEPTKFDIERAASPVGMALWRAYRRALPALIVLGLPGIACCLGLAAAGGYTTAVGGVVLAVLVGVAVLYCFLILPLVLLNRPKFLVPPHRRADPGLIRDVMAGYADKFMRGS